MEKTKQKQTKEQPTTSGNQYKVGNDTAAWLDFVKDLNNLTERASDMAAIQFGTDCVDEVMQPVMDAAIKMQDALLQLATDSIREAIIYGGRNFTEI